MQHFARSQEKQECKRTKLVYLNAWSPGAVSRNVPSSHKTEQSHPALCRSSQVSRLNRHRNNAELTANNSVTLHNHVASSLNSYTCKFINPTLFVHFEVALNLRLTCSHSYQGIYLFFQTELTQLNSQCVENSIVCNEKWNRSTEGIVQTLTHQFCKSTSASFLFAGGKKRLIPVVPGVSQGHTACLSECINMMPLRGHFNKRIFESLPYPLSNKHTQYTEKQGWIKVLYTILSDTSSKFHKQHHVCTSWVSTSAIHMNVCVSYWSTR